MICTIRAGDPMEGLSCSSGMTRGPTSNGLVEVDVETGESRIAFDAEHVPAGHPSYHPLKPHLVITDSYGGEMGNGLALIDLQAQTMTQFATIPLGSKHRPPADERFPFRNWGIWFPPRRYLNEPRPVWNHDGSKVSVHERGERQNQTSMSPMLRTSESGPAT